MTRKWPRLRCLAFTFAITTGAVASLGGCTRSNWNGTIQPWGTMREVLRDGQSQGRVYLADVISKPHAYGVGALAGLTGEIAILDGQCVISQVDARGVLTASTDPARHRATLLVVAYVPAWNTVRIPHDVPPDKLDLFIRDAAVQHGLDPARPFPFVIEGQFVEMHAHVINGACPMAAISEDENQPYRLDRDHAKGVLVGIYAENAAGDLTHHDSHTHLHIILSDEPPTTAHVEQVGLMAGSLLRLPDI